MPIFRLLSSFCHKYLAYSPSFSSWLFVFVDSDGLRITSSNKSDLEKLIDNSISPVEYKVDLLKKEYDLTDTSQKITFLTKMAEILSKVNNNIERDIYVNKFSAELKVGREAIIAEIEKRTIRNTFKTNNHKKTDQNSKGKYT